MHHPKLDELVRRDARYAYEAYEFVFAALTHTQTMIGRRPPRESFSFASDPYFTGASSAAPSLPQEELHVTGQQLLWGIRDLAIREFGLLAPVVFRIWGIEQTDDFGEIVFKLIEAGLMSKNDRDNRADFHALYEIDQTMTQGYRIEVPQEAREG